MNPTIVALTARSLLGRKRILLLLLLPAVLVGLAAALRAGMGDDPAAAAGYLHTFGLGTIVPLFGLVVGTGVIGPEIDDGSIVYLLAKPIQRPTIIVSKLAVAVATVIVLMAVPMLLAGLILTPSAPRLALGYGAGAGAAGIGYVALFVLLAVVTRHAVVYGLLYALVWESLIGGFVTGAKSVSVQQWGLALVDLVARPVPPGVDISPALRPAIALPSLALLVVLATWFAAERLRSLTLSTAE